MPAALTSVNFTRKRQKQEFSPDMEFPLRRKRCGIPKAASGRIQGTGREKK
jgi:hypothetical protein